MGKQDQVDGIPHRVLYGNTSDGDDQLWFVCDTWLHTAGGTTLVVNQRSIEHELHELTSGRLRSLITRAVAEHYCDRVEIHNLRDEQGQEERGKVVFLLNVTPVALLNLVHEMVGLETVEDPDDDLMEELSKTASATHVDCSSSRPDSLVVRDTGTDAARKPQRSCSYRAVGHHPDGRPHGRVLFLISPIEGLFCLYNLTLLSKNYNIYTAKRISSPNEGRSREQSGSGRTRAGVVR